MVELADEEVIQSYKYTNREMRPRRMCGSKEDQMLSSKGGLAISNGAEAATYARKYEETLGV